MKDVKPKADNTDASERVIIAAVQREHNHFFTTAQNASGTWHTNAVVINEQTDEPRVTSAVSEKLTVFWNNIKTEL